MHSIPSWKAWWVQLVNIRDIKPGMKVRLIPRSAAPWDMCPEKKMLLGRTVTVREVNTRRGFFYAEEDLYASRNWRWDGWSILRVEDNPADITADNSSFNTFMSGFGFVCD